MDYLRRDFDGATEPYDPGELAIPLTEPQRVDFIRNPNVLERIVPFFQAHYAEIARDGAERYATAAAKWRAGEEKRQARLDKHRAAYDAKRAQEDDDHRAFASGYRAGEPRHVEEYFDCVFSLESLPGELQMSIRFAYVKDSRQLIVEQLLPEIRVIPPIRSYRYVKSKNEVKPVARPKVRSRNFYAPLIGQIALAALYTIMKTDKA